MIVPSGPFHDWEGDIRRPQNEQGLGHKPTYILFHLHNITCIFYRYTQGKVAITGSTLEFHSVRPSVFFSNKHLSFRLSNSALAALHF